MRNYEIYLKQFNEFYEPLIETFKDTFKEKLEEENIFLFTVKAAFCKSLEFNLFTSRLTSANMAFFQMATLRSLCEDLIALAYLKTLDNKDRTEYLLFQIKFEIHKGILLQKDFLSKENSSQIIIDPSHVISSERIDFIKRRPSNSKKALLGGYKTLPYVHEMARKTSYEDLYDYFYYATSSLVHFRPDILAKMSWGEYNSDREVTDYKISINNFNHYYLDFNVIYGTYFFRELLLKFSEELNLSSIIANELILEIDKLLDRDWPELVTFEHMNIRPPSSLSRILTRSRNANTTKHRDD